MKMYHKKRRLKFIATFLLVIFIQSLILPNMAWALTSGPSTPEAMNFEPVDATDMVNLQTGDFTYNIPLLEVPGPEGGYPLSLAYHAGIMPLEDASWVGLGWSLNAGAINRTVNGYADDWKNTKSYVQDYWEGGNTKTYSVGVSVGLPNSAGSMGTDISVSNDTYKGFSGDVSFSASIGIKDTPWSASGSIGSTGINAGVGNGKASAKIGLGSDGAVTGSVGLSTKSAGNYGLSASSKGNYGFSFSSGITTMGMSLSSKGLRPSMSVAGVSASVNNANFGKISTYSNGFGLSIPITPININLGYQYQRYWMNETDVVSSYGTLYPKASYSNWTQDGAVDVTFDSYALLDKISHEHDEDLTPDWKLGGSFPAYDTYAVSGQGLTGSIQPYIFENGSLFREQSISSNNEDDYIADFAKPKPFTKSKVDFRFKNDFSNSLTRTNNLDINITSNNYNNILATGSDNPSATDKYGQNGYDSSSQHLAGSKNIEWYSNKLISQFNNGTADIDNFVDNSNLSESDRLKFNAQGVDANIGDQIGGFTITNESGVSYHYTLPVYSYDEVQRSEKNESGFSFNEQSKEHPYAYTWLLTGITGPDYVDGGADTPNGKIDDSDWGYWVAFDYGKWTDEFKWRTPFNGKMKGLDDSESYASGRKQIYYLDAIKTRTHTALFVKSVKEDGISASFDENGGMGETGTTRIYLPNITNHQLNSEYARYRFVEIDGTIFHQSTLADDVKELLVHADIPNKTTKTLKLDEILILKNKDINENLDIIKGVGGQSSDDNHILSSWQPPLSGYGNGAAECDYFFGTPPSYCNNLQSIILETSNDGVDFEYAGNFLDPNSFDPFGRDKIDFRMSDATQVIDESDIGNTLREKSINAIKLNHEYTLCKRTINSTSSENGKLTLKSVETLHQGVSTTPPLNFYYDYRNSESYSYNMYHDFGTFGENSFRIDVNNFDGDFEIGDIVKGSYTDGHGNDGFWYGLLENIINNNGSHYIFDFKLLKHTYSFMLNGISGTLQKTKNPLFNSKLYDYWGNYKSDLAPSDFDAANTSYKRKPSLISSKNLDVWSLREIETSLGANIKIDYSPKVINELTFLNKNISTHYGISPSVPNDDDFIGANNVEILGGGYAVYPDNSYDVKIKLHEEDLVNLNIGNQIDVSFLTSGYWNHNGSVTEKLRSGALLRNVTIDNIDSESIQVNVNADDIITSMLRNNAYTNPNNYPLLHVGLKGAYICYQNEGFNNFGNGVRVDQITIENSSGDQFTTKYKLDNGMSTYLPSSLTYLSRYGEKFTSDLSTYPPNMKKSNFLELAREVANELLIYSRETPPPGVMYEYAEVEDYTNGDKTSGKRKYKFQPFRKNMVSIGDAPSNMETDYDYGFVTNSISGGDPVGVTKRRLILKDKTSQVGNLLCVEEYNKQGQLMTRTINNYLDDGLDDNCDPDLTESENDYAIYDNQGITHQAFNETRLLAFKKGHIKHVNSERMEFPSVLRSTTTYQNGRDATTHYREYDFYTGEALAIETEDSYGNRFLSKSTPAYHKYPEMGLMVNNPGNKNMLTQTTATSSCMLDANGNELPISSGVTTWNENWSYRSEGGTITNDNNSNIWRKHKSYGWKGDTYPDGTLKNFVEFDWSGTNINPGWIKTSEITLYDRYSKPLEVTDVNGSFAATKMGYDQTRVLCTASNAKYTEFAFSGVEDCVGNSYCGGEVEIPQGTVTGIYSHTGDYSLAIDNNGDTGFRYTASANLNSDAVDFSKNYQARVWIHESNVEDNIPYLYARLSGSNTSNNVHDISVGVNDDKTIRAGEWYRLTLDINPSKASALVGPIKSIEIGTQNTGSGKVCMDDFRFAPITSSVSSYVYDQHTGKVRFVLDDNHLFTEYEYDNAGRLYKVYSETTENPTGKRLVTEHSYNYGRDEE